MTPSPTEEIRAIRRELSAKFNFDIHRIAEDIRQRQKESGRTYISLPKRAPQAKTIPEHVSNTASERRRSEARS